MDNLANTISRNLVLLRRQKGLSLDKLAILSGVSKAMIGQIERGDSNPTVNTLGKIAAALHVSIGRLIGEDKPSVKLVRIEDVKPLEDKNGVMIFPLFQFDPDKNFEAVSIVMQPHSTRASAPHEPGSEEYILLEDGLLEIQVDSEVYRLQSGDAIHFPADRPHIYRNAADSTARFRDIIYYAN